MWRGGGTPVRFRCVHLSPFPRAWHPFEKKKPDFLLQKCSQLPYLPVVGCVMRSLKMSWTRKVAVFPTRATRRATWLTNGQNVSLTLKFCMWELQIRIRQIRFILVVKAKILNWVRTPNRIRIRAFSHSYIIIFFYCDKDFFLTIYSLKNLIKKILK